MHVVIGGYGRVGRLLAHRLAEDGHSIAVIDHNPESFEGDDSFTGLQLIGEIFDRETLVKAGIERAQAFAACSSGDNSNIVAARIVRERFGVPRVVARIFDPQRAAIYESFGIPTASSVKWTTSRLATFILEPKVRCEHVFGDGEVILIEFVAPEELDGKPVALLSQPGILTLVAAERDGAAWIPTHEETIRTGDRLFISVVRDSAREIKNLLGLQGD